MRSELSRIKIITVATALILVILSAFLLGKFLNHNHVSNNILKTKIDTLVCYKDSFIYQTDTQLIPKIIYVAAKKETQIIDTVREDGSSVVITDTLVDSGAIVGRSVDFHIKELTVRDSIYIQPKPHVNIYLGVNYLTNHQIGVNTSIIYKNFGIQIGVISAPAIQIGILYKLQ